MPQVYDVSVRYSRKVQAREYEPIEAEVILKAQLAEGEDYEAAASKLMVDARNVVHEGIKNKAVGREEKAVERAAETKAETKAKRGRPAKDKTDDKAKSDDTFPEETGQSEKNTPTQTKSESDDSTFPDEDNESDGSSVDVPVISIGDLREKFSATVKDKTLGISGADLKALLAKHNVARCDELEDETERALVHSELLQIIESKQK